MPPEELTVTRTQESVSKLAARRSAATTGKVHRTLSLILDQAVAERRLAVNPAHGVRLPGIPAQLGEHVLSVERVEALAAAVHHQGTLVRLAAYCGCAGVVAGLRSETWTCTRRATPVPPRRHHHPGAYCTNEWHDPVSDDVYTGSCRGTDRTHVRPGRDLQDLRGVAISKLALGTDSSMTAGRQTPSERPGDRLLQHRSRS
jgi:hypothetical protein